MLSDQVVWSGLFPGGRAPSGPLDLFSGVGHDEAAAAAAPSATADEADAQTVVIPPLIDGAGFPMPSWPFDGDEVVSPAVCLPIPAQQAAALVPAAGGGRSLLGPARECSGLYA